MSSGRLPSSPAAVAESESSSWMVLRSGPTEVMEGLRFAAISRSAMR
jgi:hypothetical protein